MRQPPPGSALPVGYRCRSCKDLIAWVGYPDGIPRGETSVRVDPEDFSLLDVYCWTQNNARLENQHADTWLITCKKGHPNRVSRARAKKLQRDYGKQDRSVAVPIDIV